MPWTLCLGLWMLEKWLLLLCAFCVLLSSVGLIELIFQHRFTDLVQLPILWVAAACLYGLSRLLRSARPKFSDGRIIPIGDTLWRRRRSAGTVRVEKSGERWVWSYVPCHWKGWLLLLGVVAVANAALWLLRWLLHSQDDDARPFVVLPVAIIVGLVLAERHSPSQSQ